MHMYYLLLFTGEFSKTFYVLSKYQLLWGGGEMGGKEGKIFGVFRQQVKTGLVKMLNVVATVFDAIR